MPSMTLCACALLACLTLAVPTLAQGRGPLCIDSTIIQLWDEHRSWPPGRWEELFQAMRRLGILEVVVQWSALDDQYFFERTDNNLPSPVETILVLAKKYQMRVVMGLSHDTSYWQKVSQQDKAAYLSERTRRNAALINALLPVVRKNRSVVAWYISEEIDDLNWTSLKADGVLTAYLQSLSSRLASAKPALPVGVSAFTNSQTSPTDLSKQWGRRLRSTPRLKLLYLQDGVGVGKLRLEDVPAYYAALQKETGQAGARLVPVIEVFTQVAGPPLNDKSYSAIPAPLARLMDQVLAARRAGKVSSFGVPEYLSPVGAPPAPQAYAAWLSLLESRNEHCTPQQ